VNAKKLWRHIHLNVPIVLLEPFEKVRFARRMTRTAAIQRGMELYIEQEA
jgi:hypothetical protein